MFRSVKSLLPKTRRGWVVSIAAVVLAVVLFCVVLLYSTPGWYRPLDPTDQAVIDTAELSQDRLLDLHNALERAKAGPSAWTISQDQINALLAVDPSLASAAGKHQIALPMVRLTPGQVQLCARVKGVPAFDPLGGVVTIRLLIDCTMTAGVADVRMRIDAVHLNSLRIPRSFVVDKLEGATPMICTAIKHSAGMLPGMTDEDVTNLVRNAIHGNPVPTRFVYRKRKLQIDAVTVDHHKLTVLFSPVDRPATRPAVVQ